MTMPDLTPEEAAEAAALTAELLDAAGEILAPLLSPTLHLTAA